MRTVPAGLAKRYEAEGWWTQDSIGDLLARELKAAPAAEFRVHSATRPNPHQASANRGSHSTAVLNSASASANSPRRYRTSPANSCAAADSGASITAFCAILQAVAAKMYASDAGRTVGNRGIQIHGGMGFTWENDLHLYYRRAKASETALGDSTFHRERIARLVIDSTATSVQSA